MYKLIRVLMHSIQYFFEKGEKNAFMLCMECLCFIYNS